MIEAWQATAIADAAQIISIRMASEFHWGTRGWQHLCCRWRIVAKVLKFDPNLPKHAPRNPLKVIRTPTQHGEDCGGKPLGMHGPSAHCQWQSTKNNCIYRKKAAKQPYKSTGRKPNTIAAQTKIVPNSRPKNAKQEVSVTAVATMMQYQWNSGPQR